MAANSLVVLLGAVAGTYLTRHFADRHSGLALALLFSLCGAAITILVNYVAFWDHFRPLVELSQALDAMRQGQQARRAVVGSGEAGVGGMVESVRTLLERIEDDSLQFSARLLGSFEAERQRIGRELHDDTSQLLAASLLKLDVLGRQIPVAAVSTHESLGTLRVLLTRAVDQLKAVTYDLRPAMLDDLGLVAALRWYANTRVATPGLELVTTFDVGDVRLAPPIEITLYRVGQEALANAVKHAAATRVELGLEVRPGYAALSVLDNGKGFDLKRSRGQGLGLPSMRERVVALGGTLNIVTAPGTGTRVYAVVPLVPTPPAPGEHRP